VLGQLLTLTVQGFSNDFRPAVTLRRYKQKFKKKKKNGTRNQLN
jgi:hypothetical protein